MTEKYYRTNSINFTGLLTILFIGLKLTNQISWSWWWVLSPIWIPIAIALGILAAAGLVAGILWAISEIAKPKRRVR